MVELLSPPRGTRDFLPPEKIARDGMVAALEKVFRRYGFNPLETPALENWGVLSSKFAGGEEILKETYGLEDQGGRKLGLKYDLTVPFCRVVAANPSTPLPFKRYQIEKVWRDGPVKLGRYREFLQCDVDVVGVASKNADAEIIALTADAFKALGLKAFLKVNNRKLLNGLLDSAGVQKGKQASVILSIDKLEKVGKEKVLEELVKERGLKRERARELLGLFEELGKQKTNEALLKKLGSLALSKEGREGLQELKELLDYCKAFGVPSGFVRLDASLARGLNYYTGTVFEAFLEESGVKTSVAAGGMYNNLVGAFAGRGKVPAVGISFGLDVIGEAVKLEGKPQKKTVVQVFVAPIGTEKQAIKVAQELRAAGVNVAVDLLDRSISKNLDYANKQGIPFVAIIGEKELKEGKVRLRDMKTGKEELLAVKTVAERVA